MLQGPDDPKIREDHVELSLLFLDLCEETIEIAKVRHVPFGRGWVLVPSTTLADRACPFTDWHAHLESRSLFRCPDFTAVPSSI